MNPRVAILADKIVRGGGESLLTDIIAAIGDEVKFEVWCLGPIDDTVRPDFKQYDVEICRVRNQPYTSREKYQLRPLPAVISLLRERDVDIIHGYSLYCNVLSRIASKAVRETKSVGHHHGVTGVWSLPRIANVVTNRLADCTICVSQTVSNTIYGAPGSIVRGVAGDDIRVVYNPIDFELLDRSTQNSARVLQTHGLGEYDELIVSVGRLTESKNHRTLIRAAANTDRDTGQFVIVGGGDLEEELTDTIEQFDVEDRVTLVGQVPRRESLAIISEADLFVSTSIREGFGIALVEAMALGKPVIATNLPVYKEIGTPDCVTYIQPRDDQALSEAVQRLLGSPETLVEKGEQARIVAERYNIVDISESYRQIYRQLS